MKKTLLLLFALLGLGVSGAWAEASYTGIKLTFSRADAGSGTATSSTDDVTINVTDQSGSAISGVTASLVSTSITELKTGSASALSRTSNAVLAPNAGYDNKQNSTITYTFKVDGLSPDFTYNTAALDVYALTGAGAVQGNDGGTVREWTFDVSTGSTAEGVATFVSQAGNDICTVSDTDGNLHHKNWKLYGSNKSATDALYIKVTLTKTASLGCYAGLGAVELYDKTNIAWKGSTGTAGAGFYSLGLTMPTQTGSETAYYLSNFDLYLLSSYYSTSSYIAICKSSASSEGKTSVSDVIAVSSNKDGEDNKLTTFSFDNPVVLKGGQNYYIQFFTSNVAENGVFTRTTQRVGVKTDTSYPVGIIGTDGNTKTDWTPYFSATLAEDGNLVEKNLKLLPGGYTNGSVTISNAWAGNTYGQAYVPSNFVPSVPYTTFNTGQTVTVTNTAEDTQSADVTFTCSTTDWENPNWYFVNIRTDRWLQANTSFDAAETSGNTNYYGILTQDAYDRSDDSYYFAFTGDPVQGIKVYNKAIGNSKAFNHSDGRVTFEEASAATGWALNTNSDGFTLNLDGSYINEKNYAPRALCYYSDATWAPTDDGSTLRIISTALAETDITVNFYADEEHTNLLGSKTINGAIESTTYDIVTACGFESKYLSVTPSSVTATTESQTVNVVANVQSLPFEISSDPTTETQKLYFLTINGKYVQGNTPQASINYEADEQLWAFTGNYIDGFKLYNVGQGKYLTNGTTDNAVGAFAADGTSYDLHSNATNSEGFSLKVSGTAYNYLNDRGGKLSTWNTSSATGADGQGSCIVAIEPVDKLSELYTYLAQNYGAVLGLYSSDSYTGSDVIAAQGRASAAYSSEIVSDINASNKELSDIIATLSLNEPTAGMFLRIKASTENKKAWSLSQDAYLTSSNSTATNYTVRAAFALGSASDASTIFYYDGTTITGFANGLQPINNSNQLGIGEAGATATSVAFESIGTTETKAFRIEFNSNARSLYTQRATIENVTYYFTDAAGADATDAHYRYFLEEVTSLPVTITGAGYATLWSPVALTIPTGVIAYTAEDKGEFLTLTAIEGGIIPAEAGVILAGEAGTYNFEITTGGNVEGNALIGQATAQTRPTGSYILATGSAGVGFYADGAQTIPGFKAYLPAGTGDVKAFRFNDATAIDAISNELSQSAVYDLQGRRVSQPAHGLYIVNGKKVVIK